MDEAASGCRAADAARWRDSCAAVLRGAAATGGGVAYRSVEERPLQWLELRKQRSDLREERIGEDGIDLLFAPAAGVADELADVDFKSVGQPLERAERRNCLSVLDLRDVGPRHLHARGQLTLAQVAGTADIPHLSGNLQTGLGGRGHGRAGYKLRGQMDGLLDIEGFVATSAKGVRGSVLHEAAMLTPHYFACFHADKSGCHRLGCGAPEQEPRGAVFAPR